jgi:uncharacterized protein YggE
MSYKILVFPLLLLILLATISTSLFVYNQLLSTRPKQIFNLSHKVSNKGIPTGENLSFSVVSRGEKQLTIKQDNDKIVNQVLDLLKTKFSITQNNITTRQNISEGYKNGYSNEREYVVNTSFEVKFEQAEQSNKIKNELLAIGVTDINSGNYTLNAQNIEQICVQLEKQLFMELQKKVQNILDKQKLPEYTTNYNLNNQNCGQNTGSYPMAKMVSGGGGYSTGETEISLFGEVKLEVQSW